MSLTISHVTMLTLFLVPRFCTPNSDPWERHLPNLAPVSILSAYLHQLNPSLWEIFNSGDKGGRCNEDQVMLSKIDADCH